MNTEKQQIIQALDYIYTHIDDSSLTLEKIAQQVNISVSSLKRLFEKIFDNSPGAIIRKLRMELAFRTIEDKNQSLLEVALASGFDDHAAFSRSFKNIYGFSPSEARKKLNIMSSLEHIVLEEPEIVEFKSFSIQAVTQEGYYYKCAPMAWERLNHQMLQHDMQLDFNGLYIGIGHDNPHEGEVANSEVRFSAGVCLEDKDLSIEKIKIAGGHYARFRYQGKIFNIGQAYHYIFGPWLEKTDLIIDKALPAFMSFANFPGTHEEESVMIYVPLVSEDAN